MKTGTIIWEIKNPKNMKTEMQIGPKWARQNNAAYYGKRWDKFSMKAVEKLKTEEEEMRLQAAWMRKCVKVEFEPFHAPRLDFAEALDRYVGQAIIRFRNTGDREAMEVLKTLRIQHGGERKGSV